MNCYNKVLLDSINREKTGLDYICSDQDRAILDRMFMEINTTLNTNFHYIAEIDSFNIPGAGRIMAQYIFKFSSESIRAYLTPQIVSDKVSGVDALVIDLYRKFKSSREYISPPNEPAPAHIYSRYDVSKFMSAVKDNDIAPLSLLTDGVHLHTITAPDEETLERIKEALDEKHILLKQ